MPAGKVNNLDKLLEFLEQNISLEHRRNVEKLHVDTNKYEEVPYLPLSLMPEGDFFQYSEESNLYPYRKTFENPEKMMFNELMKTCFGGSVYWSVQLKDHFPLQIRSNHGIGIIASMFGLKSQILFDNMPYVQHIKDIGEIKDIIKRGVPDFKEGLGQRVYATYQFYHEKLKDFPKCAEGIKITHPDMQGPFDIAHHVIGSDIFLMVYDQPELLHELLELITKTYIQYRNYIEKYYQLNDKATEDMIYIHGDIYYGKVIIKDDTAQANLSPEMFEEFAWKYNKKIFDEFKGSYHSCGKMHDHVYRFLNTHDNVKGINYGNPELHDVRHIYQKNQKQKRAIYTWGWNQDFNYLNDIIDNKEINTGMTLASKVESISQGKRIMQEYNKASLA